MFVYTLARSRSPVTFARSRSQGKITWGAIELYTSSMLSNHSPIRWTSPQEKLFQFNTHSLTKISLHACMTRCNWNLFFLFLNQNICCGHSKEPSLWVGSFEHPKLIFIQYWDGSFEQPKLMFKLISVSFTIMVYGSWESLFPLSLNPNCKLMSPDHYLSW